jgi:hypothetical protein
MIYYFFLLDHSQGSNCILACKAFIAASEETFVGTSQKGRDFKKKGMTNAKSFWSNKQSWINGNIHVHPQV